MNKTLIIVFATLCVQASNARDGYVGYCQKAAQLAADAIAKINGLEKSVVMDREGEPTAIETYKDAEGYFTIVTVAGRGEGQCRVESLEFNPEP